MVQVYSVGCQAVSKNNINIPTENVRPVVGDLVIGYSPGIFIYNGEGPDGKSNLTQIISSWMNVTSPRKCRDNSYNLWKIDINKLSEILKQNTEEVITLLNSHLPLNQKEKSDAIG